MAYLEWQTRTDTVASNSHWSITLNWSYRQDPIANTTQIRTNSLKITSLSSSATLSSQSCTVGLYASSATNPGTTTKTVSIAAKGSYTYTYSSTGTARSNDNSTGELSGTGANHWFFNPTTKPNNWPAYTSTSWQHPSIDSLIPAIDRSRHNVSMVALSNSYTTALLQLYGPHTNINTSELDSFTISLNGESYLGTMTVNSIGAIYGEEYFTDLTPGTTYTAEWEIQKEYNGLITAGTYAFSTLPIPSPSIDTHVSDITDKSFKITATGILFGDTSYDGQYGTTTLTLNGITKTVSPSQLQAGYVITQEEWGIVPGTTYSIEIYTKAPYTDEDLILFEEATTLTEPIAGYVDLGHIRVLSKTETQLNCEYLNIANGGRLTLGAYIDFDGLRSHIPQSLLIQNNTITKNKPIQFTIKALPGSTITIEYIVYDEDQGIYSYQGIVEETLPPLDPYLALALSVDTQTSNQYATAYLTSEYLHTECEVSGRKYIQSITFTLESTRTNEVIYIQTVIPQAGVRELSLDLDPEDLALERGVKNLYLLTATAHQPWKVSGQQDLNYTSCIIDFPEVIFTQEYCVFDEAGIAYPTYTKEEVDNILKKIAYGYDEELPESAEEDSLFFLVEEDKNVLGYVEVE